MGFYNFAEGPLLWISFLVFAIGSLLRVAMFFRTSLQKDRVLYRYFRWKYAVATIGRWLFPFNRDLAKNPVFTVLSYIFHLCLLAVPIWFSGHVALWDESRLGWSWSPIPDSMADWMTLAFLSIAIFLFLRRIISPQVRLISGASDYLLLIVTALPFLTGYFLTHGTLDAAGFIGDNMRLIHILAGELMLILVPLTRLSHFVLFFLSRGATGIEFGRRGYSM